MLYEKSKQRFIQKKDLTDRVLLDEALIIRKEIQLESVDASELKHKFWVDERKFKPQSN